MSTELPPLREHLTLCPTSLLVQIIMKLFDACVLSAKSVTESLPEPITGKKANKNSHDVILASFWLGV